MITLDNPDKQCNLSTLETDRDIFLTDEDFEKKGNGTRLRINIASSH